MKYYRFETCVPESHAAQLKQAMAASGAGRLGNYDSCMFSTRGTGQFRPLPGSAPFIGGVGRLEEVAEVKIEFIVAADKLDGVVAALKAVHPYETPAFCFFEVNLEIGR